LTPTQFKMDFPEFASITDYPDDMVQFWLTAGEAMTSESRWGDLYGLGVELFAAHNLVLEQQAIKRASAGGSPGGASGPVSAKTVDKVSVSYDTTVASEADAGHWNLTIYGQRRYRLSMMFGAGGMQL
jgi:hypothetical protein